VLPSNPGRLQETFLADESQLAFGAQVVNDKVIKLAGVCQPSQEVSTG